MDFLREYFSSSSFMPHGHCYLWKPEILWMQVLSNGSIGFAYLAIAGGLVLLVQRGQYVPFRGMALAFGLFIVTCGITHFFDVYVIWNPVYWLDSSIRVVTAIASVGTALMLPPLIPKAVALARGAKLARERGIELEAAVDDLGRMYEKAKQLDELKTQFFANVSHELRTPLALILGPMEKLAAADNLTPDQRRSVELITRNANGLLKHVNDLLDVSKLEAGRVEVGYSKADLAELVRSVGSQFEGIAEERRLTYTVETPERLLAEVDSDKVQRVLLNLLSNAFKFTAAGVVRLSLTLGAPNIAVIRVADSGPGIRAEDREHVFERFRQLDGSDTRHFEGTGLGLTIVKDFVELHHGAVRVGDAPEGGALFEVELPLRAPAGTPVAVKPPGSAELDGAARQTLHELRSRMAVLDRGAGAAGAAPLVLVVEDNPDMNRFVGEVLGADYRVERAFDGNDGLSKALSLQPDLIVSDVMMPGMSGDQLVAAVRERAELDKVPILLLTAKADDELRVRMLRAGAQDYVTKPFAPRELRARAANLVTMKRVRDVLEREIESNIADLEQLASEVTHRKRELQTALETMRVAREQAERASRLKSDFLGLVSHELRSPLASLKIQLERLQLTAHEQGMSEGGRSLLNKMAQSADRLQSLIEALLEHARVQSGRLSVDSRPVDLTAVAEDVAEELRPEASEKGVAISVIADATLKPLHSDERLVRLILHSIASNAVKFTDHGAVTISLSQVGDEHRCAIEDTGPGIKEEDQARIFDPFVQLEEIRHKGKPGLGLGLTLVRDLLPSIGGSLTLDSSPDVGSTFTITLRRLESEPQ